jgi:hypothetical protein
MSALSRLVAVLLLSAVCATTSVSSSAAPAVVASWRSRPEAVGVAVDRPGRVYTVSNITTHRRRAVLLRAYRTDGSLLWERRWRPPESRVFALDVAIGPGGMVLVTGSIQRCDSIWGWGWIIRAWDRDGRALWQRGEPGWRECEVFATRGNAVAAAGDTVAMVARISDEYSTAAQILSFDLDGHLRWARPFRLSNSRYEFVDDVAVGIGGAIYLAATARVGGYEDSPDLDQDAVLVKLRQDGSTAWRRLAPDRTPGTGEDRDVGTGVAMKDRDVFFSSVSDEADGPRARLARYEAGGSLQWERQIRGAYQRPDSDRREVLVSTWGGGAILAGKERGQDGRGTRVALRGFRGAGRQAWRIALGTGSERFWSVTGLDAEGSIIAVAGRPERRYGWSRVWVLSRQATR